MAWRIPTFDEAIKDKELYGFILSAALDSLGYSYDIIKERQQTFDSLSNLFKQRHVYCSFVGSKGEGLTVAFENDLDCMATAEDIVCVDDISDSVVSGIERPLLLLADETDVPPGYTKLKVIVPDDVRHSDIQFACFENRSGDVYLSSALLYSTCTNNNIRNSTINGPAITKLFYNVEWPVSTDKVLAFRYKCKKLIQEWKARPRYRGWPSEEQIQEVSQLDWHVVPVGSTKEDEGVHEWRICFTLGEKYLIQTFNHAQLQLVVLLKYVSARILKPVCPAMSSYIMKNIVLWMAELLPRNIFKIQNLTRLLMLSLATLRRAVDRVALQNYMIPARNMFKDKISRDEREILMAHLDSFLLDGPCFILQDARLSRLSEAMYQVFKHPVESERSLNTDDANEARYLRFILFMIQSMPGTLKTWLSNEPNFNDMMVKATPFCLEMLMQFLNQN